MHTWFSPGVFYFLNFRFKYFPGHPFGVTDEVSRPYNLVYAISFIKLIAVLNI